jgi:hypothetical protein
LSSWLYDCQHYNPVRLELFKNKFYFDEFIKYANFYLTHKTMDYGYPVFEGDGLRMLSQPVAMERHKNNNSVQLEPKTNPKPKAKVDPELLQARKDARERRDKWKKVASKSKVYKNAFSNVFEQINMHSIDSFLGEILTYKQAKEKLTEIELDALSKFLFQVLIFWARRLLVYDDPNFSVYVLEDAELPQILIAFPSPKDSPPFVSMPRSARLVLSEPLS